MSKLSRHFPSLDASMVESDQGRLFVDPFRGDVMDLSGVQVVHSGVDTVRQLYRGRIRTGVLALFEEPDIVDFAGRRWSAGRVGRDSGYQYRLQNADLGVILLIKSGNAKAEAFGPHLKIEVSPHCIDRLEPSDLQTLMDELAGEVLDQLESGQCAVHLAVDVQGWVPPSDFVARLHCRSRRVRSFHGVDSVDFSSLSAVYGRGESFLFGSPGGIQLAVYDKHEEARVRDKLDFWRSIWSRSGAYDPDSGVYRLELRFHHSVVQQFSDGSVDSSTGSVLGFVGFADASDHLDGLWRYGLTAFRFLARPGWFDPLWTVLSRQAFSTGGDGVEYRRYYKTASGFTGKNVELLLGNFISCAARHRMDSKSCWVALRSLPFFDTIRDHYRLKGWHLGKLHRHVSRLLEERYVRWGRAV